MDIQWIRVELEDGRVGVDWLVWELFPDQTTEQGDTDYSIAPLGDTPADGKQAVGTVGTLLG